MRPLRALATLGVLGCSNSPSGPAAASLLVDNESRAVPVTLSVNVIAIKNDSTILPITPVKPGTRATFTIVAAESLQVHAVESSVSGYVGSTGALFGNGVLKSGQTWLLTANDSAVLTLTVQ
jgi:hypothetical protein